MDGPQGRALIIGYGNVLRGDDGFGPAVASLLEGQLDEGVAAILVPQQLTPDLAEQVSLHSLTVLIDAEEGEEPGRIHHRLIQTLERVPPAYQHHITPEVLAGVTLALYGVEAEIHLFSVEAASFEIGEGLSPAVSASVESVVEQIFQLLQP